MRKVCDLPDAIMEEWKAFCPASIDDFLFKPEGRHPEYDELFDIFEPIINDFSKAKVVNLAGTIGSTYFLCFVKEPTESFALAIYLLCVCQILNDEVSEDYIMASFENFITGESFSEVFETLNVQQRQILIEVTEHFLTDRLFWCDTVRCEIISNVLRKWKESL